MMKMPQIQRKIKASKMRTNKQKYKKNGFM